MCETWDFTHDVCLLSQDFVMGLSVLSRGTVDEKLRWTFNLYDINRDGYITKGEMKDVVTAVYELMGNCAEPNFEESIVNERVDKIFLVKRNDIIVYKFCFHK